MNRVVLVDDEVYVRKGLRKLINWEQCGYQVCEEADNGEEALRIIEDLNPELVITDIRMPVLDGLELLRRVRDSDNNFSKFIIISGYSDFKYAQQAIKYGVQDFILKPIDEEELSNALKKLSGHFQKEKMLQNNEPYSNSLLEQLLSGKNENRNAEELAQILQIHDYDDYFYFIVEVNPNHARLTHDRQNDNQIKITEEAVKNAVRLACGTQSKIHSYAQQSGVYGFLLSAAQLRETHGDIGRFADRIYSNLHFRLKQEVCLYAGEAVHQAADINQAYLTANEAMKYKFAFHEQPLLAYNTVKSTRLHFLEIEQARYTLLIEQIEEHDVQAIRSTVEDIFSEFQAKRYAPEAVKNSITRCVYGVMRSIVNMKGDEKQIRSLDAMMQWHLYPITPKELKHIFTEFVMESSKLIADLRKQNAKGDITKIKSYIESHFDQNLSLKSIAAKFYMNPVYLGQLFKKTYGMYFNDFLLGIRIREAKRLLRQTDMRIYEIAEKVGFCNSDYFVIQFEKVEHKTPTEYRNRLLLK